MSPHLDELEEEAGGDGSSGLLCLNCNPDPDKQQKMDGLQCVINCIQYLQTKILSILDQEPDQGFVCLS